MATENDRFNWFGKIVGLVSKHGKLTIAYCVLILFLIINIIYNPINVEKYLDRYIDNQEVKHQKGIEKRKEADIRIPDMLDVLRYKSGADRVMLLEFHNGSQNASLLPFYHFSATYESIDVYSDSIDYVNDQYQRQNTGNYTGFLEKLKKDRYIYTSDIDEAPNTKIVRKMKNNNVKSYYICAIYGDKNQMVGLLAITSSKVGVLDEVQLNKLTPPLTHQIANLISGIN